MNFFRRKIAALGLIVSLFGVAPAMAWDRGIVSVLTVLPDVSPGVQSSVEGLTVGPDGNIYVPTFGFNTSGALSGNAVLFVISPRGKVIRQVTIANSSPHMLGLAFNPATYALWVLDFGAGNVLQVDPVTGSSIVLNAGGAIRNSGLNALTFDPAGNGYVSDSFNGVIWQIAPHGGTPVQWSSASLLGPGSGLTPPFGANGVEFNNEYTVMYVADTAYHQIIQIPVMLYQGTAVPTGSPSPLITGINAPDGIMVDRYDNIWICANQEDEIVVINPKAQDPVSGKPLPKVIAKLGDFYGIDQNGIAQGFLFPASLAFSPDRSTLYVSNLTLYLPYAGAMPAIDSDWTLQVKGYTVSQIPAVIPPFPGPFGFGH